MPEVDPNALGLRAFVEADEAEVTSWFADAGELRYFAGKRLIWPLDDGQWRSIRFDPSVTAWTAVLPDSDLPIGHGELVAEAPERVRVARLAVRPQQRGHGLGRALVTRLVEKARETGHSLISLTVHQDDVTAIRGYRGIGFEVAGSALAHSNLSMEMALKPPVFENH
jgi:ribosomal protein S18 acetylase RimI-like enzyme